MSLRRCRRSSVPQAAVAAEGHHGQRPAPHADPASGSRIAVAGTARPSLRPGRTVGRRPGRSDRPRLCHGRPRATGDDGGVPPPSTVTTVPAPSSPDGAWRHAERAGRTVNVVDVVVVVVAVLAAVQGARVGGVVQVCGIVGFFAGLFVGALLASQTVRVGPVADGPDRGRPHDDAPGRLQLRHGRPDPRRHGDARRAAAARPARSTRWSVWWWPCVAALVTVWLLASTMVNSSSVALDNAILQSRIIRRPRRRAAAAPVGVQPGPGLPVRGGLPAGAGARWPRRRPARCRCRPTPRSGEAVLAAGPSTRQGRGVRLRRAPGGLRLRGRPGPGGDERPCRGRDPPAAGPGRVDRSRHRGRSPSIRRSTWPSSGSRASRRPPLRLDPTTVPAGDPGRGPRLSRRRPLHRGRGRRHGRCSRPRAGTSTGTGLTVRNVYELDADVRPGNSGGPLVLPDGEVVGVVFSRSTVDPSIGYALTSPDVLPRGWRRPERCACRSAPAPAHRSEPGGPRGRIAADDRTAGRTRQGTWRSPSRTTGSSATSTRSPWWAATARSTGSACRGSTPGRASLGSSGTDDHGSWRIAPAGADRATHRHYRGDTLVLETEFVTDEGTVRIIDCMPIRERAPRGRAARRRGPRHGHHGDAADHPLRLRPGRPLGPPDRRDADRGGRPRRAVAVDHGADPRHPTCPRWPSSRSPRGRPSPSPCRGTRPTSHRPGRWTPGYAIADTEQWWQEWAAQCTYDGEYRDAVVRSLITLKALTYEPTGGIVAAPTTSLPETIGGGAQLGLPVLLAARRHPHARVADAGRLLPGGHGLADLAAAGHGRRPVADADHVRRRRRAPPRRVGGGLAARLRGIGPGADRQRRRRPVPARRLRRGHVRPATSRSSPTIPTAGRRGTCSGP